MQTIEARKYNIMESIIAIDSEELLNRIELILKETINEVNGGSSINLEDKKPIKSYAGIWEDMPEDDFQDFLTETKRVQSSTFDTNIEL